MRQTSKHLISSQISHELSLRGRFIAIEGLDGSGKSTQIELLAKWLKSKGYDVLPTKEPTDGLWGGRIKGVQKGDFEADPLSLCFAYLADRVDHLEKLHLLSNKYEFPIILSDRYQLSFLAYQQEDTQKDLTWLLVTHEGLPLPDLTIFLDVPPEECFDRIKRNRPSKPERFETFKQLEMIREKYSNAINKMVQLGEVILIIDGTTSVEVIHEKILDIVSGLILPKVNSKK